MNVLFLAYANSTNNPLPTLSREDDGVFSVLVNRQLKGHFLIHRESFATIEKINTYLGKYQDQLTLFLYSGHANGQALILEDEDANAKGIAHQLREAALKGKLKLVVLNGCSTVGQVRTLLDAGVPVVVATTAAIDDRSATEFSIRFFQCLSDRRMNIKEAFEEALGPAQTATSRDLGISSIPRGIYVREETLKNEPIWGLFTSNPAVLDTNPLPHSPAFEKKNDYLPNEKLTQVLFQTLLDNGCREIRNLKEMENDGEYVEIGDKQTAIVNVLPFPIAIHLQKLLCPVEQENEGFDKASKNRLEQCALVFQTTVELMVFILLAQLWELKLQKKIANLPVNLIETIRVYFYLSFSERISFNYLEFIRIILRYFDTIPNEKISYFISELDRLRTLIKESHEFSRACDFLNSLCRHIAEGQINDLEIQDMCEETESNLCTFFAELGFIHLYTLTSIQNIDVQKYRHQLSPIFSHEAVKLMRAFGKPEQNFYVLPTFMDNREVALLKGKIRMVNAQKKEFTGEELTFLNLSPFVIDRNAFEKNTDLTNLMFFEQANPEKAIYIFKNVKRPENQVDKLEIRKEGPYEAIFLQLEAFRTMILNETI